jgi:hypothetical protein
MSSARVPSQKTLVERFLNWELVQTRLVKYSAIAADFPYKELRAHSEAGPYFCHYMAWRLGTWTDETLFARINDLLAYAQTLPNWRHERKRLGNNDFGAFWSLVWQLQVAEYLGTHGDQVMWHQSGPDLSAVVLDQRLFVECFVYHKAFDGELYVEELLQMLGEDLRVKRDSHLAFRMPQGPQRTDVLSNLLEPFLDEAALRMARLEARHRYPVVLSHSEDRRLNLYVEGRSASAFDPSAIPSNSGDPENTLTVALRESVNAKRQSNALGSHHPNMLVVNYLLSSDVQCSISRREVTPSPLDVSLKGSELGAIAFAVVGIDAKLQRSNLRLAASLSSTHPCHMLASKA